jgi:predicted FMN-binding regulatory protein PaiB
MYVPPKYRVTDDAEIDTFVRDHGFATLVSHGSKGLMATHVGRAEGDRRLLDARDAGGCRLQAESEPA